MRWRGWLRGGVRSAVVWVGVGGVCVSGERKGREVTEGKIWMVWTGRTRVVCNTLDSRGRSCTPVSRMEMLDARRVVLERREETHDARGLAIG